MTFLPGNIRGYFSREIYKKRMEGTGVAGTKRRIPCEKCGAELMEGSMRKHMETQHGVFNLYRPPSSMGDKDEEPRTFQVRTNQRGKYPCPVGVRRQGIMKKVEDRTVLDLIRCVCVCMCYNYC